MNINSKIASILTHYASDNPGTKANLLRVLMHGKLRGTGRLIILPVDQGFEHGPARSFAINSLAYDPDYHYQLAIEAGLSAYAAPLGMIELGASKYAGLIPTILKINSSNSLLSQNSIPNQAITATVDDALRLGCVGIGFTIYPGSDHSLMMIEQLKSIAYEAKRVGLLVIIWSYPRAAHLDKQAQTALDVCAYAAHIAALIGAHIIKVKLPTSHIAQLEAKPAYDHIPNNNLVERIKHIKEACFAGKRIVVFSGGMVRSVEELYQEAQAIHQAGGNGSIVGRNSFQRPKQESLAMLAKLINIYQQN